jgi:putative ABC transport system substrate-binding protein
MLPHREQVVRFAADRKLPAIYARREYVAAGGLMYYGADTAPLFTKTADYVHRIATGTKPGDLPVERPMAVKSAFNRKAARAQGLAVPPTILAAVEEVLD